VASTIIPVIGGTRRYAGTSADTKPTDGVSLGSTFYEEDTLKTFFFDSQIWRVQDDLVVQARLTNDLLLELIEGQRQTTEAIEALTAVLGG